MTAVQATLSIHYLLSPKYQRTMFLATGEWEQKQRTLCIDCKDMTRDERERIIPEKHSWLGSRSWEGGRFDLNLNFKLNPDRYAIKQDKWDKNRAPYLCEALRTLENYQDATLITAADCMQALDALQWHNVMVEQLLDTQKAEFDRVLAEWNAAHAPTDTPNPHRSYQNNGCVQHGSERLRRATLAGYDCHDAYIAERIALEYPGARLVSGLEHRVAEYPSLAALNRVEELSTHLASVSVKNVTGWREGKQDSEVIVGTTMFGEEIEYDV